MTDTLPTAWEDEYQHAIVLGTDDPAVAADTWNRYIADSYQPGIEEYDTCLTNPDLVRAHWRLGYLALPIPDGEHEDLDVTDYPAAGRIPIWSAEHAEPALSSTATIGAIFAIPTI
ncbi:hypothetical protein [Curtobacterium sp. MCBD17_040]|uniref:hypothetical protein n=1 Tax=Curtobacterium sp. MCBD17_040 TaxID=2175674 RepID=UPI000DA9006A|nr:hypothetical protein [Curtobacterium sp. MCBD17_040]WIB65819.1 hypothetical protein DEI94_17035 [Curtobacterium sp. MCBD17_040]